MKFKAMTTIAFALVPVAGVVTLTLALGTGVVSVSASGRTRQLHVTKECSQNTGLAGSFCTITSSNVLGIVVGARVYYDQAAGIPEGLLDSNVIVDSLNGNRAIGRCTLDRATRLGLCTFSDGTGNLAGFHARVDVDCRSGCRWDGPYGFANLDRDDDDD
jgi:hypothetical protein